MRAHHFVLAILLTLVLECRAFCQTTSGEVLGVIIDQRSGPLPGAHVTLTNAERGLAFSSLTDNLGRYRFALLPFGSYSLRAEKQGFSEATTPAFVVSPDHAVEVSLVLTVSERRESVTVTADVAAVNTTNAEIGVTFENRRLSEIPLTTTRNVIGIALNVPGVSQLSPGQTNLGSTLNFSVNGMRLRSNNFTVDGQDNNDPVPNTSSHQINNPEVVAELKIVTNQFTAEYGRAAGSIINVITKSGTNEFHGSAFWFNNNNHLNARSNLDKRIFAASPFRNENQIGTTYGGPIRRHKTFFFASYQRWWDLRLGSGASIAGPPTADGKALLAPLGANHPALKALLDNLPAASPSGTLTPEVVEANGQTIEVPRGILSGASNVRFDDTQWSGRVDHHLTVKHLIGARYMFDDYKNQGAGQITPPGLATTTYTRTQLATAFWQSVPSPSIFNEVRVSFSRNAGLFTGSDPTTARIPSMEVTSLGLTGVDASASRTAIGLAATLPTSRRQNEYQVQDTFGYQRGPHLLKAGIDVRRSSMANFFVPTTRGRLLYNNLQDVVDDVAQDAQINAPFAGGQTMQYYGYTDFFWFLQDEWRLTPDFTVTLGLRYELPGNPIDDLVRLNQQIAAANSGDARYVFFPHPGRDGNNWAPRIGFNFRPPSHSGLLGPIIGERKLVIRGGYARVYDFSFINIALNIFAAFPFIRSVTMPPRTPNSFVALPATISSPFVGDPNLLTRTTIAPSFRSPYAEQFSFNIQRELPRHLVFGVGWVATKGTALFQTVDGNPTVPGSGVGTLPLTRRNPTLGVIRVRGNSARSIYHSLQTSIERRLGVHLSFGVHYTWSTFIDTASDIANAAVSGDVAVPQDSYNWSPERARSSFDRPHRFSATFVYETPELKGASTFWRLIANGYQIGGFLTLQSGAPFTPLNGADPGFRLSGISSLVGNSLRPNLAVPAIDVSGMSISDLYALDSRLRRANAAGAVDLTTQPGLFSMLTTGSPLGNAGRNVLRASGIANLDMAIIRRIPFGDRISVHFRADFYNLSNTRHFGIPESRVNSASFLNQWGTDGGARRVQLSFRLTF